MSTLTLLEDASSSYAPRTKVNASSADLTVAFATDFTTAGERLTRRVAGVQFVAIDLSWPHLISARYLFQAMRRHQCKTLNIAGNGMYTLVQAGWTEAALDAHLMDIIGKCHEHWPLQAIRSGGQTGVDEAGLVVACALGIDATGLYPKGFKQRTIDGHDVSVDVNTLHQRIKQRASVLSGMA